MKNILYPLILAFTTVSAWAAPSCDIVFDSARLDTCSGEISTRYPGMLTDLHAPADSSGEYRVVKYHRPATTSARRATPRTS